MDRRKLESAALFTTILGALIMLPPLATLFQLKQRFFGIPAEVIYLFLAWSLLIAAAFWLGRRLPRDPEADAARKDDG
jgi:hypothetical protein